MVSNADVRVLTILYEQYIQCVPFRQRKWQWKRQRYVICSQIERYILENLDISFISGTQAMEMATAMEMVMAMVMAMEVASDTLRTFFSIRFAKFRRYVYKYKYEFTQIN